MKNNRRIVISVLLVLSMLVGMMSMSVFAAEGDGAYVAYQQVLLGDDLTMRFYIVVEEGYEDSVLTVTVGEAQKEYKISEMTADENGYYVVSVDMAAAQMTDEITLYMTGHAGELINKSYSVRAYALALIGGDFSDETKALAKELLNYGGMAQTYFKYNTKVLANEGITVTPATVPTEQMQVAVSGGVEGIGLYGASLMFHGKVAVRYYFTAPNGVEDYTFRVGEDTFEAEKKSEGLYYVEVPGISPNSYDKGIEMTVSNESGSLSVTYSPMHYIVRMYNAESSSPALKALLQAMYGYHAAAVAYVTEDSEVPEVIEPVDIVLVTVPTDDWNK